MKSKTETEDPRRVMPKTDMELPMRMNLLRESEEPNCAKSRTDRDAPKRVIPYTDIVEPMRTNDLRDRDEPK
jgi:hypothetical protein